jgi:hypothetical protein
MNTSGTNGTLAKIKQWKTIVDSNEHKFNRKEYSPRKSSLVSIKHTGASFIEKKLALQAATG